LSSSRKYSCTRQRKGIGISWGWGWCFGSKRPKLSRKCMKLIAISRGMGLSKKSHGRGMDIFWSYIL